MLCFSNILKTCYYYFIIIIMCVLDRPQVLVEKNVENNNNKVDKTAQRCQRNVDNGSNVGDLRTHNER